jgi:hypothetical protein
MNRNLLKHQWNEYFLLRNFCFRNLALFQKLWNTIFSFLKNTNFFGEGFELFWILNLYSNVLSNWFWGSEIWYNVLNSTPIIWISWSRWFHQLSMFYIVWSSFSRHSISTAEWEILSEEYSKFKRSDTIIPKEKMKFLNYQMENNLNGWNQLSFKKPFSTSKFMKLLNDLSLKQFIFLPNWILAIFECIFGQIIFRYDIYLQIKIRK